MVWMSSTNSYKQNHQNTRFIEQSWRITTRQSLYDDDRKEEYAENNKEKGEGRENQIQTLNALLANSLQFPTKDLHETSSSAGKKRKRDSDEIEKMTGFKLFSTSDPNAPILLSVPQQHEVIQESPLEVEDTESQSEERRKKAMEVAVEWTDIKRWKNVKYLPRPGTGKEIRVLCVSNISGSVGLTDARPSGLGSVNEVVKCMEITTKNGDRKQKGKRRRKKSVSQPSPSTTAVNTTSKGEGIMEGVEMLPSIFITSHERQKAVRLPPRPSKPKPTLVRKIRFDNALPISALGSIPTIPLQSFPHALSSSPEVSPLTPALLSKQSEQPKAAFFRPLSTWGGKSRGYAVGYESSWAVDPKLVRIARRRAEFSDSNGTREMAKWKDMDDEYGYRIGWKYRRDAMRKGVLA